MSNDTKQASALAALMERAKRITTADGQRAEEHLYRIAVNALPEMVGRLAITADAYHKAKHGTLYPTLVECSVEICIKNHALLMALEQEAAK